MNYRKKILIILGVFLLISLISYVYAMYIIGCNKSNNYSCSTWVFNELIPLIVYTPLFISASLIFLIIFSERVFKIWKKFAMLAIPLMLIGILSVEVSPVACGNLICVNRTFMIFFTGYLYLVLSILATIISAVYLKSKSKS